MNHLQFCKKHFMHGEVDTPMKGAMFIEMQNDLNNVLISFLKYVGDGHNFEDNAEQIVNEYVNQP